jgi:peptide/nickel transport system permease protein
VRRAWIAIGLLALACYGAPLWCSILGIDPFRVDPASSYAGLSLAHPLGADQLGRDVLARLLYGGRVSLAVGALAAIGAIAVGGAIGILAGWFGGLTDAALMRFTELVLSLPRLPLMMLILALDRERIAAFGALPLLISVIALLSWPAAARMSRASAIELKARPFVEAARALGASDARIVFRHLLPNALPSLFAMASVAVGDFILYESALSYLGLGVEPTTPSWGAMLGQAFGEIHRAPLLMVFPGLLTFLAVAAFNRAGEALQDALDPRASRS